MAERGAAESTVSPQTLKGELADGSLRVRRSISGGGKEEEDGEDGRVAPEHPWRFEKWMFVFVCVVFVCREHSRQT